jgi:hypothetical protein
MDVVRYRHAKTRLLLKPDPQIHRTSFLMLGGFPIYVIARIYSACRRR